MNSKRLLFALVFGPLAAVAHDPGLSTATVDFSSHEILVQVSFAPADLAAFHSASLAEFAPRCVELQSGSQLIVPKASETRTVGADNVEFTLRYPRPRTGAITFRAPLLDRLPFGHRQSLTVRDETGATLATELLSADRPAVALTSVVAVAPAKPVGGRIIFGASLLIAAMLGWRIYPRRVTAAA